MDGQAQFQFQQTDMALVSGEEVERLIAGLKTTPSWTDQADTAAVSQWIVRGWAHLGAHRDRLDLGLAQPDSPVGAPNRLATVWARLTRDLVSAGPTKYQDALRPAIAHIVKLLWFTSAVARLDHPHFKALNQSSLQALSNLNTLNPRAIEHTWPLLMDCDARQSILPRLLYTRNNRVLLPVGVLVLNCVHGDRGRIDSLTDTPLGRDVMRMLLERLDALLDDQTEMVFEVIVKLVREIVALEPATEGPKLYHSQATPSQVLSPGQLAVLKVLDSLALPPSSAFLLAEFARLAPRLDSAWQGFVLLIHLLVSRIEIFIAAAPSSGHKDALEEDAMDDPHVEEVVRTSIRILKEVSDQRSQLMSSHDPSRATSSRPEPEGEDKKRSINQILSGLVKLITHLIELKNSAAASAGHPDSRGAAFIQDLVRTMDGFPVILSFTKFDVDFPYLREHAIVLLKYLLKNNPDNQAVIRDLEPLNAVPTPTTRTVELQPGRAESESGSPLDKHGVVDSSGSLGGYVSLATSHTSRDQRRSFEGNPNKPCYDNCDGK
ncbi:hypothetical protein PCANC_04092 [Puccinia coronata f. sp. avenae]|uniref:Ataxin-10 homolog n=1 Tax=Puccinia coronata f. sp. avenae TaxID=200324 RepID=A0A2N5W258_9BASI|nr:hypothetical protein PCANC_04092 [Puccinia coronata f. sp. avenae]